MVTLCSGCKDKKFAQAEGLAKGCSHPARAAYQFCWPCAYKAQRCQACGTPTVPEPFGYSHG